MENTESKRKGPGPIYAYLALALGAIVWLVPEPFRPVILAAVLALGVLYVRAMNRRARKDVQ